MINEKSGIFFSPRVVSDMSESNIYDSHDEDEPNEYIIDNEFLVSDDIVEYLSEPEIEDERVLSESRIKRKIKQVIRKESKIHSKRIKRSLVLVVKEKVREEVERALRPMTSCSDRVTDRLVTDTTTSATTRVHSQTGKKLEYPFVTNKKFRDDFDAKCEVMNEVNFSIFRFKEVESNKKCKKYIKQQYFKKMKERVKVAHLESMLSIMCFITKESLHEEDEDSFNIVQDRISRHLNIDPISYKTFKGRWKKKFLVDTEHLTVIMNTLEKYVISPKQS